MHKVLVVDDDKVLQQSVKEALEFHHFRVDVADNGREAVDRVVKERYDLVVMDVNMPELDGINALSKIKAHDPTIIVLILTAFSNVTDAVKAVKEGAYNYIEKPIASDNLVALIKRALRARSLVEVSAFSAPRLSLGNDSEDQFVGESSEMKKVFSIVDKLAKVNTPVLIRGESGTGKELVARAIHFNGPRKEEHFVTINLAAVPEGLVESELFGHEKGAFTGAHERKIGKFQYANGGTLFLDEIGDISPSMQVKLLRVLQERSFTPVGSNREVKVDVRVIAASHRPFEEMIKEGSFREDLFYRLNVLPVYLPPLRQRKSDLGLLVDYYMEYFNKVHNLEIKSLTSEAQKVFQNYDWPGNIRELRNVIEHAFIVEPTDYIHLSSLPEGLFLLASKEEKDEEFKKDKISLEEQRSREISSEHDESIDLVGIKGSVLDEGFSQVEKDLSGYQFQFVQRLKNGQVHLDFQEAKDLFEKEFITQALSVNRGKINQTALKANIPKKTLLRKIDKYGLNPKNFYE